MTRRALLFAYDFPPMPGGIASALGAIARHAGPAMVVSTGTVETRAGADDGWGGQVDRLPVPSDRLRTAPGLVRWARRGQALVLSHQPGILWAGNLKPAGHVAHWLGRRHRIPYGVLLYGGDVLRLERQVERSRVKRLVARRLLGEAGRIAAISQWTLDRTLALARELGIPGVAERAGIIPLGVDSARFHADAGAGDRAARRRGASHWLLTVSRLVPHKGVDVALEVVRELRGRGLDVGYMVVGDGPDAARLARRAAELGLEDAVRWLGAVPEEALPSVYAAADAYLGLSRQEGLEVEGFGLALLEAQASGVPVIAGASGGTGDVVLEDVTGFRVPPRDAVAAADRAERVLRDASLARRLGAAGRALAGSRFSWDRTVAALLGPGEPAGARVPGGN
jgi:phosphatidylinositol alpha-1,6-mannosyltransferase